MPSKSITNDAWPSTQRTLLVRLRDTSDHRAWEAFVDLYLPLVYRFCRKRGVQDADARDIAQDVLLQVSRSIQGFRYDPDRGRFRGWLGTLAQREMWRHLRTVQLRGTQLRASSLGGQPGPELDPEWIDEFNEHVYRTALDNIRHEFSQRTWQLFESAWDGSCSINEMAKRHGCKPHHIYQAKYRVIQRLREEIIYLADDLAPLNR